jgi:hypothetical protein
MSKITITRALSEKKTLLARFERETRDAKLIGVSVGKKMQSPYNSYTPEDFEKQVVSSHQSLKDIMKRITQITFKINESNFVTKIKVAGKEMTVLEALVTKSMITQRETMLLLYKRQLKSARSTFDEAEERNKERIEKNVADQTSAGSKDKDLEAKIKESIENLYPVSLIDHLKIEDLIRDEEKFIEDFKGEIDFVLSESNSLTYIEIED